MYVVPFWLLPILGLGIKMHHPKTELHSSLWVKLRVYGSIVDAGHSKGSGRFGGGCMARGPAMYRSPVPRCPVMAAVHQGATAEGRE